MKKIIILIGIIIVCASSLLVHAQSKLKSQPEISSNDPQNDPEFRPSLVNYDSFKSLVDEVEGHRAERLLGLEDWLKKSKEKNTIILDTRSKAMYESKHIKGAIHLNFADFTQTNLDNLINNKNTTILIYCNNNFDNDDQYFASKMAESILSVNDKDTRLTLALNIPTYINLYGYGYRNVYELSELISVFDTRVEFEGTSVVEN